MFKKYDKDGNGYIERGELDTFLSDVLRQKVSDADDFDELKKHVLEQYDKNSDGKISMSELALILPTQENYLASLANNNRMHVVDFMKIWYHYDKDKSGYLEQNELKGFIRDYLMHSLKSEDKITPQIVDERTSLVLETFDKNKDGKIEVSELSRFLNVQDNYLVKFKNENDGLSVEQFDSIFDHYDADKNGYIEDVELLAFLKDLLQSKHREPTAKDLETYRGCILEISDKDNDGKLSKAELKLLLIPGK